VLAWRIVRPAYAADPLSGEGAAIAGTRWTSVGIRIGYASTNRALAVLEMLVHMSRKNSVSDAVLVPLEIPDHLISGLPELPEGWNRFPYQPHARRIGDQWIKEGSSVAMFVASAILPAERNVLVNPLHPQFSEIRVGQPEPHAFDRRLFRLR
jgi:RES domain-containing protein